MASTASFPPQAPVSRAAYLLGHATTRLPLTTRNAWMTADGFHSVPESVEELIVQIEASSAFLVRVCRGRRRLRAQQAQNRIASATNSIRAQILAGWNSNEHMQDLAYRDRVEEVLADHVDTALNPLERLDSSTHVAATCWRDLDESCTALSADLPDALTNLTRLGRVTARAFDYTLQYRELFAQYDTIRDELVRCGESIYRECSIQALAQPLAVYGTAPRLNELRGRLWLLHQAISNPPNGAEVGDTGVGNHSGKYQEASVGRVDMRLATAVGLLALHPDMPFLEAADLARVNRTALYRVAQIQTIQRARQTARSATSRGHCDRDPDGGRRVDSAWTDESDD